MKQIFTIAVLTATVILSGCGIWNNKEQQDEIARLEMALADQKGMHAAELEYSERQASFYLGCKTFFNRCSEETAELGQKLLKSGFTGKTSGWYWVGLLGEMICFMFALVITKLTYEFVHLIMIRPKEREVERAQKLMSEIDNYIEYGNRWKAEYAAKMINEKSRLSEITREIWERSTERDWLEESLRNSYEELGKIETQIEASKIQRIPTPKLEDF